MRVLRYTVIGAICAAILIAFSAINLANVRYNEYPCQFDLIYNESGQVDLAIIGSSRTVQGIGASEIGEDLKKAGLTDQVIYNLGKSWRGEGINYTIARDLLEIRKVDVLFVEANLPESSTYHAHFFLVGRYSDLARSALYQQANGVNARAIYEIYRMPIDRLIERGTQLLLGNLKELEIRGGKREARTAGCRTSDELVNSERLIDRFKMYKEYYEGQVWNWDIKADEGQHDRGFIHQLVELAESNGTRIAFYYVHESHYMRLNPEFSRIFQEEFGAPLLIPPDDIVDRLEASGYADPTHFNKFGRHMYSSWLAEEYLRFRNREGKNDG